MTTSSSAGLPTTNGGSAKGHIGLVVLGSIAFGLLLGLLSCSSSSPVARSTR